MKGDWNDNIERKIIYKRTRNGCRTISTGLWIFLSYINHTYNFRVVHVCTLSCFSRVQLFVTLRTVARQAPLSMQFSKHEYWSGLLFPPPGDLPDPEMEPSSPALAGGFFINETNGSPPNNVMDHQNLLAVKYLEMQNFI